MCASVDTKDREISFRVADDHAGDHLDKLVAHASGVSRRTARTWISAGRVSVGGKCVRILTRPIRGGSLVSIRQAPTDRVAEGRPSRFDVGVQGSSAGVAARFSSVRGAPVHHSPLDVIYADRYLVAVNKPAGLLSEHDRFGSPSLESLVPAELRRRGERDRVWLVHRLDAGTSGVIVLARTPMAVKSLGEQFRDGASAKRYLALCRGRLEGEKLIDAPIARAQRTKHEVSPHGKPAATRVLGLATIGEAASLVRAEPLTGRTHQIRVHLAHLGFPLWGDGLYGGPTYTPRGSLAAADALADPIGRPMLHATRLVVTHPKSGERLVLGALPPRDFLALTERLGLQSPDWNRLARDD